MEGKMKGDSHEHACMHALLLENKICLLVYKVFLQGFEFGFSSIKSIKN